MTTEPERFKALLNLMLQHGPQRTFKNIKTGESFPKRFYTPQGMIDQLNDFTLRQGLVFFIDPGTMCLRKTAFEKTNEEHYGAR